MNMAPYVCGQLMNKLNDFYRLQNNPQVAVIAPHVYFCNTAGANTGGYRSSTR